MDRDKLHFFYNSKKFSDCSFLINDVELRAHKLILACKSPVFEKMFFGAFASNEIKISDVDLEEFNRVLKFIYIGNIDINSVNDAWNLFYIARKYLLDDLMDVCLCYIKNNYSLNSLVLSYEYAEMFNQEDVKNKCFSDMINYARGVFNSDYHMKASTISNLLENIETRHISNFELLTNLIDWAVIKCDIENIESTAENIVSVLKSENLLKFISKDWLLRLTCSDCFDPPVLCQCLSKLAQQTVLLLENVVNWSNDDNNTLSKAVITPPSFCKRRAEYKIACRIDLQRNEVFVSTIGVSRPLIIFGVLVKTQMNPASLCENSCYNGSVTITICEENSNKSLVMPTMYAGTLEYDSEVYVPLRHLIVLQPDVPYDLRISYANLDYNNKYSMTPVHCYYMTQDLMNENSVVSFYEMSGTLIKGLSFYPAYS